VHTNTQPVSDTNENESASLIGAGVAEQPIRHQSLDAAVLNRIMLVHRALRDVLCSPSDQVLSLEQFETSFLRCESPAKDVEFWEGVATALEKAQSFYPPEQYDRRSLYRRLLFMICGTLTEEQWLEEDTSILTRCFRLAPNGHSANNVAGIVICSVCNRRTTVAGAAFCTRCGQKLV
jgi:hypothetical protein